MRVVIAGGGTGGHLYPGLALAEAMRRGDPGSEVRFIGTSRGLERRVVPRAGFTLSTITARAVVGRGLVSRVAALLVLPIGIMGSVRRLLAFRPHVVVGTGGYVSVPVLVAAWLLRVPRLLLEPNAMPGLATRLLVPLATVVVVGYPETAAAVRHRDVRVLGVPVRPGLAADVASAAPRHDRPNGQRTLLVVGGSRGAHSLNLAAVSALEELSDLRPGLTVIHQTGEQDYAMVQASYNRLGCRARVEVYIEDMAAVYAEADLVVSRAGAMTVAELAVTGKPAVLVPYPYANAHQEGNALILARASAAVIIPDGELSGARLACVLRDLLSQPARLQAMAARSQALGRRDAAARLFELCRAVAGADVS